MAIDTLEIEKLSAAERIHRETDEQFEKRRDMQKKILEELPKNFLEDVKKRINLEPGERIESARAGAIFEILSEQQHKIELEQEGQSVERSELANELLDLLKVTCDRMMEKGKYLRRPDLIDIRESENGGKIEIVAMVETTLQMLGRRKYLQLRDFKTDFERFLDSLDSSDFSVEGYTNISNDYDKISIADELRNVVYVTADKNTGYISGYAEDEGMEGSEWDEFETILRENCDIRYSAFSSREIGTLTDALASYF